MNNTKWHDVHHNTSMDKHICPAMEEPEQSMTNPYILILDL